MNPGVSLDRFFVCIKDHYTAQDPRYKAEYWREDQCGKTLFSCSLGMRSLPRVKMGTVCLLGVFHQLKLIDTPIKLNFLKLIARVSLSNGSEICGLGTKSNLFF